MRARAFALSALVIFPIASFAGPEGGQIVGGVGTIEQINAATTQINQATQAMAIDWESFNVAAGETVQFVQPGTSAIVLNRILDQNPSTIFGTIDANGQVFLINTRGILFAETAQLNVGGLMASGLDMDPAEFMEGQYRLQANGPAGYVVNHGVIAAATGGSVVLTGGQVVNTGTIRANYGRVTMAGAEAGYVDFDGDGLMRFEVTGELQQKLEGEDAAVVNRGVIEAVGGQVVMEAAAARGLFDTLVNNEGIIVATGIDSSGGQVRLVAVGGDVVNSGTIDVSSVTGPAGTVTLSAVGGKVVNTGVIKAQSEQGTGGIVKIVATLDDSAVGTVAIESSGEILATSVEAAGGFVEFESNADTLLTAGLVDVGSVQATGGTIHVLGERVAVMGPTRLGSTGGAGGGTILIGGDYQGRNPLVRNASRTYVGPDAFIDVSAINSGSAGRVIVWSEDVTRYFGTVSARGPPGGTGGFVEISGKQSLVFSGQVDTSAPFGTGGTLLLDPNDLIIANGAAGTGANDSALSTTDGTYAFADMPVGTATISEGTLEAVQATTNIVLQANVSITLNDLTDNNLNLAQTPSNSVTFEVGSGGNITMLGANDTITTAGGALTFTTTGSGSVVQLSHLATAGGAITFNSAGVATVSGVISGTGTTVTQAGTGTLQLSSAANSYTGGTVINSGYVSIGADGNLGDSAGTITFNGGTLNTLAAGGVTSARNITLLAGGGTIFVVQAGATTSTFSGTISGVGALNKEGTGALVLSGANTYTGATTVSAGTLAVTVDAALGTNAAGTSVAGGATLDFRNVTYATAEALTINGGTIATSTGTSSFAGGITLGAGSTVNVAGTQLTLSGIIGETGGARALTKSGSGILVLSGVNTYTGGTAINGGTLSVGADSNLGGLSGTLSFDGGTLLTTGSISSSRGVTLAAGGGTINTSGVDSTFSGVFGGAGALTKTGAGILVLSGANTYAGLTTISAGTLSAAHAAALGTTAAGTTVSSGATLNINGVAIGAESVALLGGTSLTGTGPASLAGTVSLAAAGNTIDSGAGSLTLSGIVSGGNDLTKAGAGILVLSGANDYTGLTTISTGTLSAAHATALGTTAAGTTVSSSATLNINGVAIGAEAVTLNGGTSLTGTGTASLAGTVSLAAAGNTIDSGAGSLTLSGIVSGANDLTKAGAGTLVLSGANDYAGLTTISAGTLSAAHATALGTTAAGTTVSSSATLNINGVAIGAETVTLNGGTALTGTGTASLGGAIALAAGSTIDSGAGSLTLSGIISGANDLTKAGAGTLVLSGANDYTGLTTISAGTLSAAHATALGTTAAGTTVSNGATLNINAVAIGAEAVTLIGGTALTGTGTASLDGAITLAAGSTIDSGAGSLTLSGVISGGNTLTKTGAGILVLSGTNTYSGGTTLSNGTLRGTVAAAFGTGTLTLSGGTLQLANDTGTSFGNNVVVTGSAVIQSDRATAGAGVTHTLGTLSIGANTLTVNAGGNVNAGTAGVTFGATTLTGNATISGNAALTLGAVDADAAGNNRTLSIDMGSASATFSGAIGATKLLSALTVSAGSVSLGAVTTNATTGVISLTADEITLSGSLSGGGALTLRPLTAGQDINVAGADSTLGTTLDLTSAELAFLADGFSSITIGRTGDGTGIVTVAAGGATLLDDVTLVGGSIVSNGTLTSTGNTVTLTARVAGISDGNGPTANVVANALSASAITGIDLDTTIATLNITGAGGAVDISDADSLIIGNIAAAGQTVSLAAGGAAGSLTDTDAGTSDITADTLNLTAGTGGVNLDTTVTTVNATVTGGVVDINEIDNIIIGIITATGQAVTLVAGQNITGGDGETVTTVNVTASTLSATASNGSVTLDTNLSGALTASATNSVTVVESDGLTVANVTASGTSTNVVTLTTTAGSIALGTITADSTLLTTTGSITDGNGATTDITAPTISLLTQGAIGASGDPLELASVTNLTIDVETDFFIAGVSLPNLTDLSIKVDPSGGTDTYSLTGFSGLTLAMSDCGGVVTGCNGGLGTAAPDDLLISGTVRTNTGALNIAIITETGSIYLSDANNIASATFTEAVAITLSGGGNITLTAAGSILDNNTANDDDSGANPSIGSAADNNLVTTGAINFTGTAVGSGSANGDIDVSGTGSISFGFACGTCIVSTDTAASGSVSFSVDPANEIVNLNVTTGDIRYVVNETCSDGDACLMSVTKVSGVSLSFSMTATSGDIWIADNAITDTDSNAANTLSVSLTAEAGQIGEINNNTTAKITIDGTLSLSAFAGISGDKGTPTSGSALDIARVVAGAIPLTLIRTGNGDINIRSTGALTLSSYTGAVTGATTLTSTGALNINSNLNQAGSITLTATETGGSTDDLTVGAGIIIRSTAGDVLLQAGDDVILVAGTTSVDTNTGTGTVTLKAGSGDTDSIGDLVLNNQTTVASANTTASAITLQGRTISISTTGGLEASVTASGTGGGIRLFSATGVETIGIGGGAGDFSVDDAELNRLTDFDVLTIGQDTVQSGVVTLLTVDHATINNANYVIDANAGAGSITLTDAAGPLTALTTGGSGSVTLRAGTGGITSTNLGNGIAELTTGGTGVVSLTSAGPISLDLSANYLSAVTSAAGTITVNSFGAGDSANANVPGGISVVEITNITVFNGDISFTQTGGASLLVDNAVTTNGGNITLSVAGGLALRNVSAFGAVSASTTGSGGIIVGLVSGGTTVTLNSVQEISEADGVDVTNITADAEADVVAPTVSFIAGTNIGSAGAAVEVGGGTINLASGGNIDIAAPGSVTIGTITTSGGADTVSIAATGTANMVFGTANTGGTLATDTFTISAQQGSITFSADQTAGAWTITTNGAAAGQGDIIVNAIVATPSVTEFGFYIGPDIVVATSGSGGSVTGTGSLATGNVTYQEIGNFSDTIQSGAVSVSAAEEIEGISVATGDVHWTDPSLLGADGDFLQVGDITLSASHLGTSVTPLNVSSGTPTDDSGGSNAISFGGLNLVSTAAAGAGDIFAISTDLGGYLILETLDTGSGADQVSLTVTGGAASGTLTLATSIDEGANPDFTGDQLIFNAQDGTFSGNGVVIDVGAGSLSVTADTLVAGGLAGVTEATGGITVAPFSAGRQIGLGFATGQFDFTDGDLDALVVAAGGALTVGNGTSGAVLIDGITFDPGQNLTVVTSSTVDDGADDATAAFTGTGTLTINAGDIVGGPGLSGASGLDVDAGTVIVTTTADNVTLTDSGANGATVFSVNTNGAGDVTITQSTSSLLVGTIVTSGTVQLNASAGAINDDAADTATDIRAGSIDLNASAGIGNTETLELASTSISADTTSGAIRLANDATALATVTVSSLTTSSGSINFDQIGGQALVFTSVDTNSGGIVISNTGANLTATSLQAGSATADNSDITLQTLTSGDVLVALVDTTGDDLTITSAGAINESGNDTTADLLGATYDLDAVNGIGTTGAIELAGGSGTLNVNNSGTGAVDLAIANITASGNNIALTGTNGNAAANQPFTLTAINGLIDTGAGLLSTQGGTITLIAAFTSTSTSGSVIVGTGGINSNGGAVTLRGADSIVLSGSILAAGNTVTLTADDELIENNGPFPSGDVAGGIFGSGLVTADTVLLSGNGISANLAASNISAASGDAFSGTGSISISNTLATAVVVSSLTTQSGGNISFTNTGAGGVSFGTVSTAADATPAEGEADVTLTSDGGPLTVTTSIDAGGLGDIVLSTISAGNVILTGTTTASADDVQISSVGNINGAGLVTGLTVDLGAATGIGEGTQLQTAATDITAANASGAISISNTRAAGCCANADLVTDSGNITFVQSGGSSLIVNGLTTTSGDITVTVNNPDEGMGAGADSTGDSLISAGAITLSTVGSGFVVLGDVRAATTLTVNSADYINDWFNDAGVDAQAATIDFNAATGIGTVDILEVSAGAISADSAAGDINLTNVATGATVVSSLSTGTGSIAFVQTGNQTLTVTSAGTTDGAIGITNDADLIATSVVAGGGVGDNVTLTASSGGNVFVDGVSAADTVTIMSAGVIENVDDDAAADLQALTVNLNAALGIGTGAFFALDVSATSIAANTVTGGIDLDSLATGPVTVSTLTTDVGDITFDQTGNQAVTFTLVDTNDGLVALSNTGADLTATSVTAGTAAADGSDITFTTLTSGNVILGSVNSTGDDVTVTSAGQINDDANDAGTDITSASASLTAATGIGAANGSVDLSVPSVTLLQSGTGGINVGNGVAATYTNVATTGAGDITVAGTGASVFTLVTSNSGSIALSATGGDLTATSVTAGGSGADLSLSASGAGSDVLLGAVSAPDQVTISSAGTISESAADGGADVTAVQLTLTAGGPIDIDTDVGTLSGSTTGAGDVLLDEAGALVVTAFTVSNGAFTLNTGGATTLTSIVSTTSGDANDISVTAATGDLAVGTVNAGGAGGDVTLAATTGAITNSASGVTGDVIMLTAQDGIGASGNRITTTAASLAAATTGAGTIWLNETDGVTLSSVTTADGLIDIVTGGDTTVALVASSTDSDANDITILATAGNILVDLVDTDVANDDNVSGDITITAAAGSINDFHANPDVTLDVRGDVLTIDGATGAGNLAHLELDGNTLDVDGGSGGVGVNDLNGGTVTLNILSGGDVFYGTDGTLYIDQVIAGGTVTLSSFGGSIQDDADDVTTDIVGTTVTLNAYTGIGGDALNVLVPVLDAYEAVEIESTSLDLSSGIDVSANLLPNLAAAAIIVRDVGGTTLADLDTINGDITVLSDATLAVADVYAGTATLSDVVLDAATGITDAGAGDVVADLLTADAGGPITLSTDVNSLDVATSAAGAITIAEADDVTLTSVSANSGAVSVTAGGSIAVTSVSASGQTVTLDAGNAITDTNGATTNVTGTTLNAAAVAGINLDTDITTLNSASAGGIVDIADADDLAVNTVSAAGQTVSLTAGGAGAITDGNADGTTNVTATTLNATAGGGVDLDTDITTLDSVTAGGTVDIADVDSLAVNTIMASGQLVNLAAGGAGAITDGNADGTTNVTAATLDATADAGITLDTAIDALTASNTTSGGVDIADADGFVVNAVSAPGQGVTLDAGSGALDDDTADALTDITATTVNLIAATGIGATDDLETAADVISGVNGAGDIDLNNDLAAGEVQIDLVATAGNIFFDQTGGASVFVNNAVTNTSGDITITATDPSGGIGAFFIDSAGAVTVTTVNSGEIIVREIIAATTATLTAATTLNEDYIFPTLGASIDPETDITATNIVLVAGGGIGETEALELSASTLSADTTNGNVALSSLATGPVTASSLSTGTGSIVFSQTGGQALDVTTAATGDGPITITNAGADLTVVSVSAGGVNNVSLTTTVSGDIVTGAVTTAASAIISAAGAIADGNGASTNVTASLLDATAVTGIDLDTAIAFLTANNSTTGDINVADADGFAVNMVSAAGQTVTLNGGTGALTDNNGAAVNITASLLDATAATGIDLDTAVAFVTASNSTSGGINVADTDGFAVNTVSAAGQTVTLNGGTGALTDNNGAAVNVTASLLDATAATGIDLDTAITFLTANNSTTGDINVADADGFAVNTVSAAGQTVTLNGGTGAIADNNGAAVNVTASLLDATATTGIDLDTAVAFVTASNSTSGGINVADTDGFAVNTVSAAGQTVTLNGGTGALTDNNGALTNVTASLLSATAATGIDLDTATDSLTLVSTATVDINDAGDTVLAGVSSAGSLVLVSGGALTDGTDGDLAVTGNAALAGTSITLGDDSGNATDFGTLTFTSPGAVSIAEDSATQMAGASTADSLALASTGPITQTAGSSIIVVNLTTLTATGNNIVLDEGANDFGTLAVASANGVSVADVNALILGAATVNTLTATAGGALTDAGNIGVVGSASFSGASITLGSAGETTNFGTLTFSSPGAVTIEEDSSTTLAGSSTAASLTLTALGIDDGASATLNVTGATVLSAGGADVVLDNGHILNFVAASDANDITLVTGAGDPDGIIIGPITTTAGGNLAVTATAGDITSAGALVVDGAAQFIANGAGSSIVVDDAGNAFNGTVSFGGTGLTTVAVTDSTLLDLAASTLAGDLTVVAQGITASGPLTIGGTASFDAGAGNDLILINPANDFNVLAVVSAADVQIVDANAVVLGAVAASGDLTVTAAGISGSDAVVVAGLTTLDGNGANIVLDGLNDFVGALTVSDAVDVTLNDINGVPLNTVTIAGTFNLSAGGLVSDANAPVPDDDDPTDFTDTPATINITAAGLTLNVGSFGEATNRVEVSAPTTGTVSITASGDVYADFLNAIQFSTLTVNAPNVVDILAEQITVDADFGNTTMDIVLTARTVIVGGDGIITADNLLLDALNRDAAEGDIVIGSIDAPILLDMAIADNFDVPPALNGVGFVNEPSFTGSDFQRIFTESGGRIFVIANFTDLIASVQGSFITAPTIIVDSSQFRTDLNIVGTEGAGFALPLDQCEDEESADCAKL